LITGVLGACAVIRAESVGLYLKYTSRFHVSKYAFGSQTISAMMARQAGGKKTVGYWEL